MRIFTCLYAPLGLVACFLLTPLMARANGNCPSIGNAPSCGVLITITPTGRLSVQVDPNVGPYDGADDSLVGVVNNSGATVYGISLTGNNIFGFDGDGICTFVACSYPNPTTYEGPGTSFSIIDANSGTVNFTNGLGNNGFLYFGLEGPPSSVKLTSTVTLDPGHGTSCTGKYLRGAVGDTSYPDLPPPGFLQEDLLTVAVALQTQTVLSQQGYTVAMTKTSTSACPTFGERAEVATQSASNMFVSIHVNAPISLLSRPFCGTGTSVLYNGTKTDSKTFAQLTVGPVSSSIGVGTLQTIFPCNRGNVNVNHDGTYERDNLQVLKLSTPTAILVETARLSQPDEDIVHMPTFAANAATGIADGIVAFVNQ